MHDPINGVVPTEASEQESLIQVGDLKKTTRALYEAAGVPKADAELMADLQVETDVRGVHSHGTRQVPGYLKRLQSGQTNPKPEVRVTREGPAWATVDGDGCLGHLASYRAMQLAIGKANELGIAATTVVHSRHFGAAACYATMALEHDMIGFCVSSSSSGVAPYGGIDPLLGNHALAYAIPAGEEYPIVLDMATGRSAWGRVGTMRLYGQKLDGEWVLDENGQVTDDPHKGHALVAPGGPKGSGFNVVMDVLSSVLPFGVSTVNRGEEYHGQRHGSHFFQAIKVETFCAVEDFKREVDQMIQTIRASQPKEGVDRIYVPGEIEWLKKAAWEKSGIPLHKTHVGNLEKAAQELGIEVTWK
jgi:LDH2 family malate/lactate/ureidoglycolate dehydrogenase